MKNPKTWAAGAGAIVFAVALLAAVVDVGVRLPRFHEAHASTSTGLDYSAPPFGRFVPLSDRFLTSILGTKTRPSAQPQPASVPRAAELPIAEPGSAAPKATPVTVQPDGRYAGSTESSGYPKISGDGRSVAFISSSPDLDRRCARRADGSFPCGTQVYVRDVNTGVTELVSLTSSGEIPNAEGFGPSISADGRYVVWHSVADNIVAGDRVDSVTHAREVDVFLRDRLLKRTERVTAAKNGSEINGGNPSISADGRFVAFDADFEHRDNLYTTWFAADVYMKDRQTGNVTLVSVGEGGQRGNHDSRGPLISPDGRHVVFWSRATNFGAGPEVRGTLNGFAGFPWGQVYVFDLDAKRLTLECVSETGAPADDTCWGYNISAEGRFSTFWSTATNLVAGSASRSGVDQIMNLYLRDRLSGSLELINVTSDGRVASERWPREIPALRGGKRSPQPYLSWDGSIVGFETDIALVPEDRNELVDAYIRDRVTGRTLLMSEAIRGRAANGWSQWPCLSSNGSIVSFMSAADNLAPGDDHDGWDVFVRRWRR